MDYAGRGEKQGVKCMEPEARSAESSTNCQMCKSIHTERTTQYSVMQKQMLSLIRTVLSDVLEAIINVPLT